MSKPPTEQIRVVVVGAGFGGIATVKALGGAPVAVTLVDSNNFHTFPTAALPGGHGRSGRRRHLLPGAADLP